jgi:nucleoside phosphorylase
MPMHSSILVLSAHPPELSGLRALLGDDLRGTSGDLSVVGRTVGIGLVAAAAGAAAALEAFQPRAVILVGTCGAYQGRGISTGEVVVGRRVCLASTAVVEGRGAFPGPMLVETDLDGPLSEGVGQKGVRRADVATTLAVTTDDRLAATVSDGLRCDVEHLEAFAVARACAEKGVPLAVVLGVANMVGSSARAEWQMNHRAAGDAAGTHVALWLDLGAPGLARS